MQRGRRESMCNVFGERATWSAMRKWIAGTRRPPQWVLELTLDVCQRRIEAHQHVLALLREELARPRANRLQGAVRNIPGPTEP